MAPAPQRQRPGQRGKSSDGRDIDHLILDGFIYEHLENPAGVPGGDQPKAKGERNAARMRTRWLEGQSTADLDRHFKPQAWMQLARRLSAQGYHDEAREIAIARRRRQRKGASASRLAKLQNWCLDIFALYGFNPWRTVIWMFVFVLSFSAIWSLASSGCTRADCKDETVFVMALKGNFGQDDARSEVNYPAFAPLAYSFDVFMPLRRFRLQGTLAAEAQLQTYRRVPRPASALAREGDRDGHARQPALRSLRVRDDPGAGADVTRRHRLHRHAEHRGRPAKTRADAGPASEP